MRLGILGGAFNPPHIGHLACAQEAWWQLGLDRVWLMPAGEAPHKTMERDPGPEERFALCEVAAAGTPWLEASRLEIDRPGPSYTVETLRELRRTQPDDELVLVLGADRAASLPEWREPEEILRLATVAVTQRKGVEPAKLKEVLESLGAGERVTPFEMPLIEVSSTLIRERIVAGRPYRFFVPEPVAERIEQQGLYREPR